MVGARSGAGEGGARVTWSSLRPRTCTAAAWGAPSPDSGSTDGASCTLTPCHPVSATTKCLSSEP